MRIEVTRFRMDGSRARNPKLIILGRPSIVTTVVPSWMNEDKNSKGVNKYLAFSREATIG